MSTDDPDRKRCGECDACKYVTATRSIVLAECNPPFSHATDSTVRMWNKVLADNPCQAPR